MSKPDRVTGIEPALSAWEAEVLPLNYTRETVPGQCRRPAVRANGRQHTPSPEWSANRGDSGRAHARRRRGTSLFAVLLSDRDIRAEIEAGRKQQTATDGRKEPLEPGVSTNPSLMPSQLGYSGGLLGMFKGNSSESKPFKGEPTRESLTEPPPGYQTPSAGFDYGTGPMKPKAQEGQYDVMTGKPLQ